MVFSNTPPKATVPVVGFLSAVSWRPPLPAPSRPASTYIQDPHPLLPSNVPDHLLRPKPLSLRSLGDSLMLGALEANNLKQLSG